MLTTVLQAVPPVPLPRYPVPLPYPAWVRVRTWNDHHDQP